MSTKKYINLLLDQARSQKVAILGLIFMSIIGDTFLLKTTSDIVIFLLLGLYVLGSYFYKTKSAVTFLFSLFLLIVMYLSFLFTGASVPTEKAAVWLFFFILVGIVQQIRE